MSGRPRHRGGSDRGGTTTGCLVAGHEKATRSFSPDNEYGRRTSRESQACLTRPLETDRDRTDRRDRMLPSSGKFPICSSAPADQRQRRLPLSAVPIAGTHGGPDCRSTPALHGLGWPCLSSLSGRTKSSGRSERDRETWSTAAPRGSQAFTRQKPLSNVFTGNVEAPRPEQYSCAYRSPKANSLALPRATPRVFRDSSRALASGGCVPAARSGVSHSSPRAAHVNAVTTC